MITCCFESGDKFNFRHVTASAIVEKNNKIILVKRASFLPEPNKFCFPGGYLEQDETIEQGVLRETREETGFNIKINSLFRINGSPARDRGNIDFIFLAQPLKEIGIPDKEVTEVKWFDLNNLPPKKDIAFDHYENIELYLKYREEKLKLPILNIN